MLAIDSEVSLSRKLSLIAEAVDLHIKLVEFALRTLALSDDVSVSPSFAEMDEAIQGILSQPCSCGAAEESYEEGSILPGHQLVLSFCWLIMKGSCLSMAKLVKSWNSFLSPTLVNEILRKILFRILIGTRYKGAMEAAHLALFEISCELYKPSSNQEKRRLIEEQVLDILNAIEHGVEDTSVTRRAAGLSMIFTGVCEASNSNESPDFTLRVTERFLYISQMKPRNSGDDDVAPATALHILQSLVLSSASSGALKLHLPDICLASLRGFFSPSWDVRNASLQLYGAVVSRMLGEKKVKDDSAAYNSITIAEFLNRSDRLSTILIDILNSCRLNFITKRNSGENVNAYPYNPQINVKTESLISETRNKELTSSSKDSNNDLDENWVFDKTCKNKTTAPKPIPINFDIHNFGIDSRLVPVLSLLARISPGTETQQNSKTDTFIRSLMTQIIPLLAYPVYTVRRLVSITLVRLTPLNWCESLLSKLVKHDFGSNDPNFCNGVLLTVKNMIESHSNIVDKLKANERLICFLNSSMKYACPLNSDLVADINNLLSIENPIYPISTRSSIINKNTLIEHLRDVDNAQLKQSITQYLQNEKTFEMTYTLLISDEFYKIFLIKDSFVYHMLLEGVWSSLKQDKLKKNGHILQIFNKLLALSPSLESTVPINQTLLYTVISDLLYLMKENCYKWTSINAFITASVAVNEAITLNKTTNDLMQLVSLWSSKIKEFGHQKATEEYRYAASTAINLISLKILVSDPLFEGYRKAILIIYFRLLQDEDDTVRNKASAAMKCTNIFVPFEINPNVSLRIFVEYLALLLSPNSLFDILWDVCLLGYQIKSSEIVSKLFESTVINPYEEPVLLSSIISLTFEDAAPAYFERFSNVQGEELHRLLHWVESKRKFIVDNVAPMEGAKYANVDGMRCNYISNHCNLLLDVIEKHISRCQK